MDYTVEAFEALVAEVERQGGALLPDTCIPQDVEYTMPPYATASEQERVTCGCGNEAKLVTIYDPKVKKRQGGSGYCAGCAVCDSMGAWPRYCRAVYAADPELDPMYREDEDEAA